MRGGGMSIASSKLALRYTDFTSAPQTCGGCAHGTPQPGSRRLRCAEGFYVARTGWCVKYTPRDAQQPDAALVNCGNCVAVSGCLGLCARGDGRTAIGPTNV